MTERNDDQIDQELSGIAMSAALEHERTVSAQETEAALQAVRSRADAGDLGGSPPSIDLDSSSGGRRRSAWVLIGAAAAVVAMIAGVGLVTVTGDGPADVLVPATVPAPVTDTSGLPTTVAEEPIVNTTTAPTTAADDGSSAVDRQTLSVDAADPPRLVEPVPYASVPLDPNRTDQRTEFAVGVDHVIVNQPGTFSFTVVALDEGGISAREVFTDEDLSSIVSGPGPIVYGLGEQKIDEEVGVFDPPFVAIPFLGNREGDVVAMTEIVVDDYFELPPFFFGHGPDGVIARDRNSNETVIGYVDQNGGPRDSGEATPNGRPFPLFDVDRDGAGDETLLVDRVGSSQGWELDIARDQAWDPPYIQPGVVAPGLQRAVYFERIGLNTTPNTDFGTNLMPVVALMNPDGSGEWIRLPDDWDVVASDVWGTLLARFTDDSIELALLDDLVPPPERGFEPVDIDVGDDVVDGTPTTTAPSTAAPEPEVDASASGSLPAVERQCASEFDCTSIALADDGRIVTLDPFGNALSVFDSAGEDVLIDQPIAAVLDDVGPELVAVGPDDVAYVRTFPSTGDESAGELLAIPLGGPQAGTVVRRSVGLPVSGGTAVEPRRSGLAIFLCCGNVADGTFPPSDVRIEPWVDRHGDVVESGAPSFDLDVGDAGNSLTRIDVGDDQVRQSFQLPAAVGTPRNFPDVVAADDGGALASFLSVPLDVAIVVDMARDWPRNRVDNGDVFYLPVSEVVGPFTLEPSGTVIAASDDGFVRRTLDEFATRGWPGSPEVDGLAGTVEADGLDEYIDENAPFWAGDPVLFAYQLKQTLGPNETVLVEVDDSDPVITITLSGFLDDSVAGARYAVTTTRGDDGLLRFESATYRFRCARGQDTTSFQNEPCI